MATEEDNQHDRSHQSTREVYIEGNEDKESTVLEDRFRDSAVNGQWSEVISTYETDSSFHKKQINKRRGTALHVAVNDGIIDVVKRLIHAIVKHSTVDALELKNDRGDTPLHLAATRGFTSICKIIVGENEERKHLVNIDNQQGETPLFLAALSLQKQAFAFLCSLVHTHDVKFGRDLIRYDGDSILHCAIWGEFFDLALIIIHYFPELRDSQNREGFSPLKLLATRPSAFMSGCKLIWWKKILYHCITVETLDVEREIQSYLKKTDEPIHNGKLRVSENYHTCYNFFSILRDYIVTLRDHGVTLGGCGAKQQSSERDEHKISIPPPLSDSQQHVPPKCDIWHQFVKFAYTNILSHSGMGILISDIRKMKQKHKWSGQLLSKLMEDTNQSYMGSGAQPYREDEDEWSLSFFAKAKQQGGKHKQAEENEKKEPEVKIGKMETPILTAARNGIVEMVIELRSKIPSAVQETTSDKKNILLVAVSNRQPLVVDILKKILTCIEWYNLIIQADDKENTMLHLAAEKLSNDKIWPIPGSAMQMMWDIKWYQYIKQLVPDHLISKTNKDDKTAAEIFKVSHGDLATKSSQWLKETSESCSVVTALIAGVSFATSTTVPGGNIEDIGKPALEGQPAFDTFALASLIGLCFSVNALIMFLAILTSRKQTKDFRKDLPLKLLLGLSSLFVSIVAMFVSFCAGHFVVLKDEYKHKIVPLYVATCFPVSFYAVAQFPLYADLLKTILMKVPQASDKGEDL